MEQILQLAARLLKPARTCAFALSCGALCAAWADTPRQAEFGRFHHTAWTSDSGLGAVLDIQQTSDGFLWLTTSRGLLRFDGVRFQTLTEVTNGAVRGADINSLFIGHHGELWLTTRAAGLLRWENGSVTTYPDRRCTPTVQFSGIVEDTEGSLWIASSSGLYRVRGTACELIGEDHGVPAATPAALLVDRRGTVWVKTRAGSLLYLPRGESRFRLNQMVTGPSLHQGSLRQAPDGSIWFSFPNDLRAVVDPQGAPLPAPASPPKASEAGGVSDFTFTPDHTLWHVTPQGIEYFAWSPDLHSRNDLPASAVHTLTPAQGLSSNGVWKILIGREGGVWVGTNSGLDQFRKTPLVSVTLPNVEEHEFALAAGDNGSVWMGNNSMPLTHVFPDGHTDSFSQTHAILCLRRDRTGAIWAADNGGDVPLWRITGSKFEPFHFPNDKTEGLAALELDSNGDPWILTWPGSMYRLSHGTWIRQNDQVQRKLGMLGAMTTDQKGNLWIGFGNRLVKWDGNAFQYFTLADSNQNISVSTMAARGAHVWLAGRGGVTLFLNGRFYLTSWKDANLPGRVSGIVETEGGDLWINTFSGVTHVTAAELARWIADPASSLTAQQLDTLDGLPGFSAERVPEPSLVQSPDGILWFATTRGVARLDPVTLQQGINQLPPSVVITSVTANGAAYSAFSALHLPKHTDHLTFDYTAPSLPMPARVQFRYKLEGADDDWQNAGTRRQAFYTSLPPGHYTFRVIAANNDHIWNETGATLSIDLAPSIHQTVWFKTLCALGGAFVLWLLYISRLRRATAQLRERMTERIDERERIARELHDTLLQSFQALILYFQTAIDRIDENNPIRLPLEEALRRSDLVMAEGRERVRNLRASIRTPQEFADLLTANTDELRRVYPCGFEMLFQGTTRETRDHILEEVYQIAREALTNAFRHAGASRIELVLHFLPQRLMVLIQDNGSGIPNEVLKAGGREGHWGLTGMAERARKIGASLELRSTAATGTAIELRVAASVIYKPRYRMVVSRWLRNRMKPRRRPQPNRPRTTL